MIGSRLFKVTVTRKKSTRCEFEIQNLTEKSKKNARKSNKAAGRQRKRVRWSATSSEREDSLGGSSFRAEWEGCGAAAVLVFSVCQPLRPWFPFLVALKNRL